MAEQWPAVDIDGWTYSHNAIRLDLEDTLEIVKRMKDSSPCQAWEYDGLKTWWGRVFENIHQHHDHEERFFFPKIQEKVKLPERLSSDHATMMQMMKGVDAAVNEACKIQTAASMQQVVTSLSEFQQTMLPHLKEEEDDTLPTMHKNFVPSELKPVMDKMIAEFKWYELPHFYRQLKGDRQAIRNHCTGPAIGMPGFVYDYLEAIPGKLDQYDAEFGWLVDELKNPSLKKENDARRELYKQKAACGCKCM